MVSVPVVGDGRPADGAVLGVEVGVVVDPEVEDATGEVDLDGVSDGAADGVGTGSAVTSAAVGSVDAEGVGTEVGTLPRPPVAPLHAATTSAITTVVAREESRLAFMVLAPLVRR